MFNRIFNKICELFARHYIPPDDQQELANALFNWKYVN
jgi:hypothetical protein